MSSTALPQRQIKQWHVIVFGIVAGLLALLVLYGGSGDLLLLSSQSGFPSDIHRWHEGQSGALMVIVFGGCLLALLWRPQNKPLLAQFLVLSIAILCLAFATVSGAGFNPIVLAIGGVLIGLSLPWEYSDPAARLCRELGDHWWHPGHPWGSRLPRLNAGGGSNEQAHDRFRQHRHAGHLIVGGSLFPRCYQRHAVQ